MKSDLVIANGELGLFEKYEGNDKIWVKRLAKGFSSWFDANNVHWVNLSVIKKGIG